MSTSQRFEPYPPKGSRDRDRDRERDGQQRRDQPERKDQERRDSDRDNKPRGTTQSKWAPAPAQLLNPVPVSPIEMANAPRAGMPGAAPLQQLYIGNTGDLDKPTMESFFQTTFGSLAECKMIIDRQSGKSKGFGFVSFHNPQIAHQLLSAGKVEINGVMCTVKTGSGAPYRPGAFPDGPKTPVVINTSAIKKGTASLPGSGSPAASTRAHQHTQASASSSSSPASSKSPVKSPESPEAEDDFRIYIKCSKRVTEDDLYEQFESFGEIVTCVIHKEFQTNHPKGTAHIVFAEEHSAISAVEHMNELDLYDEDLLCNLGFKPSANASAAKRTVAVDSDEEEDAEDDEEDDTPLKADETSEPVEAPPETEEEKARQARLQAAITETAQQAQVALKDIDIKLAAAANTRQYNPEDYDY